MMIKLVDEFNDLLYIDLKTGMEIKISKLDNKLYDLYIGRLSGSSWDYMTTVLSDNVKDLIELLDQQTAVVLKEVEK